ncbi:MAG: TonB-dependent receptor, partial [Saprospiraceae bacterium]|nr:TonB-dependent receptor [Saprospiraceae bacterium]
QSTDLIIPLSLDASTGSTSTTVNVAEVTNKGVELGLNVTPLRTDDLYLNIGWNFTKNTNTVEALRDGTEELLIDGLSFLGNFAIPGSPYGVIKGTQIVRDEATGRPIVGSDGLYQQASEEGVIGDPNPDYLLSTNGTIAYKGLALRVQFDYRRGGDIWASTPSTLFSRGILQESGEFDRFVPIIVPGLIEDSEGNLVENTVQNTPNDHFWRDAGVFYDENRMFDGTNLRLREISLAYSFPKSVIENTPLGGLDLILSGQNLWYKSFNIPEGANFDPEVLSLGVGNGQGFDFVTGPTSKRWGGTIRLTF